MQINNNEIKFGKGYKRIFKFNDGADPLFTVSNKRIYFTQFDYNKKKNKLVSRVYSISLKGKNKKLEKDALENAGNLLSSEDYGEMLIHLKKLEPGFINENQS